MHNIKIGTKQDVRLLVTAQEAVDFLGLADARVLSTPHLIGYMERTSRDTVLPALETGYDTVGTKVAICHLAAAPIGSVVTFTSEITAVQDRRVEFHVTARSEEELTAKAPMNGRSSTWPNLPPALRRRFRAVNPIVGSAKASWNIGSSSRDESRCRRTVRQVAVACFNPISVHRGAVAQARAPRGALPNIGGAPFSQFVAHTPQGVDAAEVSATNNSSVSLTLDLHRRG